MRSKLDKMKQRVQKAREHIDLQIDGTSTSIMADLNMPIIFLTTGPKGNSRVGLAGARDRSQSEKDPGGRPPALLKQTSLISKTSESRKGILKKTKAAIPEE